jgi:hypothetical protein
LPTDGRTISTLPAGQEKTNEPISCINNHVL